MALWHFNVGTIYFSIYFSGMTFAGPPIIYCFISTHLLLHVFFFLGSRFSHLLPRNFFINTRNSIIVTSVVVMKGQNHAQTSDCPLKERN